MSDIEPTKNYVYQPYPAFEGGEWNTDGKLFSVAGPDVKSKTNYPRMTQEEAQKEADRLNKVFHR